MSGMTMTNPMLGMTGKSNNNTLRKNPDNKNSTIKKYRPATIQMSDQEDDDAMFDAIE